MHLTGLRPPPGSGGRGDRAWAQPRPRGPRRTEASQVARVRVHSNQPPPPSRPEGIGDNRPPPVQPAHQQKAPGEKRTADPKPSLTSRATGETGQATALTPRRDRPWTHLVLLHDAEVTPPPPRDLGIRPTSHITSAWVQAGLYPSPPACARTRLPSEKNPAGGNPPRQSD